MEPHEIVALAEMVKSISEVVWNIALLKVQADGMVCLWWGFVFLAGMIAAIVTTMISFRHASKEDTVAWDLASFFSVCGIIGFLLGSAGFFAAAIMRFIAPAYFAIQIIRGIT